MKLKQKELMEIIGGGITASMISAISDILETIFDIGKSIGSAINRLLNQKLC